MSLNALNSLLESTLQFQHLQRALARGPARLRVQVLAKAVPFTLSSLWRRLEVPTLVVAPRPEDARRIHDQLVTWSGQGTRVLHFPETETLPFERLVSDVNTTQQRLRTLSALLAVDRIQPPIIVASATAIAQKTIDRESFVAATHGLSTNQRIDLSHTLEQWRQIGYQLETTVYAPGYASRRGGILDIFPVGNDQPARIELWGDKIDSIRLFDPATQRSAQVVDSVNIIPARESLPGLTGRGRQEEQAASLDFSNCTEDNVERIRGDMNLLLEGHEVEELSFYSGLFNHGSLLDYFPKYGLLVMCWPSEILEAAEENDQRAQQLRRVKESRGELPRSFPSPHLLWGELEPQIARVGKRLDVESWRGDHLVPRDTHILPFTSTPAFLGKLDSFAEETAEMTMEGHIVVAVTSHSARLGEILAERGVTADLPTSLEKVPAGGSVTLLQSRGPGLADGFIVKVTGQRLVVFSDAEIFGVTKQRRPTRRAINKREAFLEELSPGDYVVHVEHGIARFVGTGPMSDDKDGTEYLILQYAQGDKLYVPMQHLDRVTSYVAPMDHAPSLTRLGTREWRRTKERVARSTREMAADMLSLYAARELTKGHSFAPDPPWQSELETSFPYEETPDQLAAIGEVKTDMESPRPMDRLVCGDVGYGKTEIALRAAFKAVMGGKQVAILVPTTVLAQQHYVTFSQRLSAYPVAIEVLSRFRTEGEQRQITEGLANGRIDMCIGTHRLIQKDVRFKDLGLVVIDEEQRFGVAHKERLKRMRREVDVLTMTATPIPRTLHMSLAGVRDMSTMETPPEERLPIKTYVSEFSDELIREAILRELDRQGQVYFLHNRVHNIEYMAIYLRQLVPEARVGVAHGQMPESELERAMIEFADGKMDVLACTTIIESGLDIPNVNTLIVNRADTFGLSQLYQLRGRVGRSARRAYAYLLVQRTQGLSEAAQKRLKAMLAATELGAGFRIAMKDLEIRGAGNILGAEQSGHIHAVGFNLYTRLLSNAVEELRAMRAAAIAVEQEVGGDAGTLASSIVPGGLSGHQELGTALSDGMADAVDLDIPASIPQDYVVDLSTRLGIYQRLARLAELADVDELADELRDRFGPLPWQAQNLLYIARLKQRSRRAGVESITREGQRIVLQLSDEVGGARRALQRDLGEGVVVGNAQIRLELGQLTGGWEECLVDTMESLADFRDRAGAEARTASAL